MSTRFFLNQHLHMRISKPFRRFSMIRFVLETNRLAHKRWPRVRCPRAHRDVRCARCHLRRNFAGHDACIRNLAAVKFACCGHGKAKGLMGYVWLRDGRRYSFEGSVSPRLIRIGVARVLVGGRFPFKVARRA